MVLGTLKIRAIRCENVPGVEEDQKSWFRCYIVKADGKPYCVKGKGTHGKGPNPTFNWECDHRLVSEEKIDYKGVLFKFWKDKEGFNFGGKEPYIGEAMVDVDQFVNFTNKSLEDCEQTLYIPIYCMKCQLHLKQCPCPDKPTQEMKFKVQFSWLPVNDVKELGTSDEDGYTSSSHNDSDC